MAEKKETGEVVPVGYCNFRNKRIKFGIKLDDRRRHVYVVGKTGVGKTTLLENMVVADMLAGHGVGIVDPHGEFAERMLDFVPQERLDDVIYFNPADMEHPLAFNPMESVNPEYRHLVASGLMGVFKKIWPDVWSARMEYILNNTLLALLELPNSTVLGIIRMLSEPNYRKKIVENIKDPVIKGFWTNEFARYTQRLETEAVAAIQNKVGQFVSNPLIRNILGQPHSSINMREAMDKRKIFIANLSKGKMGEDNSALLGSMIITRLQLAAMSRVDTAEQERKDFLLYVDEFQNFATDSFANILSEARKYRLCLTLSHQYIGQLVTEQNTRVRDAVFGNVGTIICFRVGGADAEFLEKEFMPEFLQQDLVGLAKATIYTKLMIDGVASRPFSAETIPPPQPPLVSYKDEIIKISREKYGTPRATVEEKIASELKEGLEKATEEKGARKGERSFGESSNRDQNWGQRRDDRPRYQDGQGSGPRQNDNRGDRPRFSEGQNQFPGPRREYGDRPSRPAFDQVRPSYDQPRPTQDKPHPVKTFETKPFMPKNAPPLKSPQIFPKKDLNIDDLRQAISKSLSKDMPSSEKKNNDSDKESGHQRIMPPPIRNKNDAPEIEEPDTAEKKINTEDVLDDKKMFEDDITGEETKSGEPETVSLEELAEKEENGESIMDEEDDVGYRVHDETSGPQD